MNDVICNPWNVVALAGKRIRMVPIEDVGSVTLNDPENHGVPFIVAPAWEIAKTVAAYDGTWCLIFKRGKLPLLAFVARGMPGHE